MAHPLVQKSKQDFIKAIEHLSDEFNKLQIGRASSGMVDTLMVESYGVMQPIKNLASVSIPDARTIQIQPWDRSTLAGIEKAIRDSDLNLNPSNNGLAVMLNIPPLTEERRRDLVKVVGRMSEEAKIAVRNLRHEAMAVFKKMEHAEEMSEDERKGAENALQEEVDAINKQIEELAKKKEDAIMTL
ncbi:MAG: ribosome recycling factor [Candidatus Gracilibacteria bacterium]|jgi:ribosome recycling factor